MRCMNREEIQHLATLSRLRLTDDELGQFESELSSIIDYVGVVSEIAADGADTEPTVGSVHNVFRKDEVRHEPDQYTNDILEEMPHTEGRYLAVKKILRTED